jgi:hypothetical protein
MVVVTQLYFQIVEEINYMLRPFSVWAIVRLKLEYLRKLTHYNVDYTSRMGERDLVLQRQHTLQQTCYKILQQI